MNIKHIAQYQLHLLKKANIDSIDSVFEQILYKNLYEDKNKIINTPYQTVLVQKNTQEPVYVQNYTKKHEPIITNQLSGNAYVIKGPFYGHQLMIYIGSVWSKNLQVFYIPDGTPVYCHAWKMDFIDVQRLKPLGLLEKLDIKDAIFYKKYKEEYAKLTPISTGTPIMVKCQDGEIELPQKTLATDSLYLQKLMTDENFTKTDFISFKEFSKDTVLNYFYGKPFVVGTKIAMDDLNSYLAALEFCIFVIDFESVANWHLAILQLMQKLSIEPQTEADVITVYQKLLPDLF